MSEKISVLTVQPGISRDSTNFSSRSWIDGEWVRFQFGMPRKMGGYKQLTGGLPNIPRKVYVVPNSPNLNIYIADFESVKYLTINQFGEPVSPDLTNRTPNLFAANLNNNWKFDTMYDSTSDSGIIVAHAAASLNAIDSTIETPVYYGDILSNNQLIPTGHSVSGGIVALHPYLFMYGNYGDVKWTTPSDVTQILESARVTGSKIVAGMATRGGNTSPAGLLWSLDSVIRITNVGVEFSFDTVTDESSILSSNSIIEYDGIFYWIGVDRFLMYNGTVQELKNDMSINFFFENLNYAQRQKVWATKITRFGEIWWHFPKGTSTEANWALIYNVREQTWYDTPSNAPTFNSNRSAGYFPQVFPNPIWASNVPDNDGNYSVWIHEKGYNKVMRDNTITPILSKVQSCFFSFCAEGIDGQVGGMSKNTYLYQLEPDFISKGDMALRVQGKSYANSTPNTYDPIAFNSATEKIDIRIQAREMSLIFENNAQNGSFQMGKILTVVKTGDDRP
jgi:hypothetical protein